MKKALLTFSAIFLFIYGFFIEPNMLTVKHYKYGFSDTFEIGFRYSESPYMALCLSFTRFPKSESRGFEKSRMSGY